MLTEFHKHITGHKTKKKTQKNGINIIVCQVCNANKNWVNHVILNKNCPKSQQETENQFKVSVLNLDSPEQRFGSSQNKCVHEIPNTLVFNSLEI